MNATHALNILLKGFLKSGDHVLISNFEHNSVLRPLHKLTLEKNVSYTVFSSDPEGNFHLSDMIEKIRINTKLIVINHASNVIGVTSPLKQICQIAKMNGIPVLVDLSQTAGVIPIDIADWDVDFAAGTGHKGLLGPSGVGFLYVKTPDLIDSLYEGGSGPNSISKLHPAATPVKFEAGTLNYLGISGLLSTLGYIKRIGRDTLYNRSMQLIQEAIKLFQDIPEIKIYGTTELERKIPILSFNLSGYCPAEVSYLLDQHGICVRAGLQCAPLIHETLGTLPHGTVRMSVGHLNTSEEIGRMAEVLAELIEQQTSNTINY